MNTNAKKKAHASRMMNEEAISASKAQPVGPTLAQLVSLTLDMSEAKIYSLIDASSDDQDWSEVDHSVDFTTRLVLDKIKGMRNLEFKDCLDFISAWLQVTSSIELCARAFSCPNTYYGRELCNLRDYTKQALNTVEFVGMREKLRSDMHSVSSGVDLFPRAPLSCEKG